jgi:hypothetical protein
MHKPVFASLRQGVLAGAAVLVIGGAAAGVASAQADPTPTPNAQSQAHSNGYQAFLAALAKRLNVSPDALQQAITGARTDAGLPANAPGFGREPDGGRGPRGGGFGPELNAAAQVIGISADQLRQELANQSLPQVAQAHSKNPADVANALKTAANQRIDQAVADGHLTADQATQRKQQTSDRIDQMMTQSGPAQGGPGRGDPGVPGGHNPGTPGTPGTPRPTATPRA